MELVNFYEVPRLAFASSCSVYGAAPGTVFLNEGSYLNPVSLYAQTRIDSEKIIFLHRGQAHHPHCAAPGHGVRLLQAHAFRPGRERDDPEGHGGKKGDRAGGQPGTGPLCIARTRPGPF